MPRDIYIKLIIFKEHYGRWLVKRSTVAPLARLVVYGCGVGSSSGRWRLVSKDGGFWQMCVLHQGKLKWSKMAKQNHVGRGFFADYSFWRTGESILPIYYRIRLPNVRPCIPMNQRQGSLAPFIHSPWDSVAVRRRMLVYWLRLVRWHSEWICLHSF